MLCIDLFFWNQSPATLVAPTIKSVIFWPFGGWIAPQFWTLPVEIMFYGIVWMLITVKAVEHLDRLAIALVAITAFYWSAIYSGTIARHWQMDTLLLLQHGSYFAIGICLSSADRKGLSPTRLLVILAGIALAAFDIPFAAKEYGAASPAEPHQWLMPFGIWLAMLGLMIISLRWKSEIADFVRSARLGGLLRTVGLSTYPLYLIHLHVGGMVMTLAFAYHVALLPAVGLGIAVSVAVSVVLALVVEPHIRRLILFPLRSPYFRIGPLKLLRGMR
jgi:peptidoglycan/LPS O-acetylase OafA/YrhL